MGKIKAVRSKKFKGGINTSIAGPGLPESLYKYKNTDKIKGLYDIYDENYICYDLCEHQAEIINNKQMKINEHYHNVFQNLEGYDG
jgi:hypothetical protein